MAKWLFFGQIAILALFSLCINFKISFCQMTFYWLLWKTYYTLDLKKCLWPPPGPSMYLSKRIDWIISSFTHRISQILFVFRSWGDFEGLGCRIGTGYFFWYLNFWKNTVKGYLVPKLKQKFSLTITKNYRSEERKIQKWPGVIRIFCTHIWDFCEFGTKG